MSSAGSLMIGLLGVTASASAIVSPPGLTEAVHAYDDAQVKGDRAVLQRLLADDYVLINSSGREESREEFIADLTAPGYKLEPYKVLHPIVRTSADSAIEGGVALLKGLDGGKPFEVCLRFVDVWSLRGDGWKVGYSQAARTNADACKGA